MATTADVSVELDSPPVVSTAGGGTSSLDAPPPSYDSLFGKVKQAKEESSSNFEFGWKMVGMIFCNTLVSVLLIALWFSIPITCIVIGSVNLKNCTIEKYIPIYLVVAGVFGVIKAIVSFVTLCVEWHKKKQMDEDGEEIEKKKPNPVDQLLNCFLFAWFIAGSVWVYKIYGEVNYDDPTSDQYCEKTTYLFTFWIITISYIMLAFIPCCCCIMCCIMCCVACGKLGDD